MDVESLVISLIGDAESYLSAIGAARATTTRGAKEIARNIKQMTKDVAEDLATVGMNAEQAALKLLELRGAKGPKFEQLKDMVDSLTIVNGLREKEAELLKEGADLTARYTTSKEAEARSLTKFKALLDQGAISLATYIRATADVTGQKALNDSAEEYIKKLERQAVTFNMSARQAQIYDFSLRGVGAAQLDAMRAHDAALTAMEQLAKKTKAAKDESISFVDQLKNLSSAFYTLTGFVDGVFSKIGKLVTPFGEFDKAMTQSTAIMLSLTTEQRQAMEKMALDLSTKFAIAPEKIAQSFSSLIPLGLSTEETLKAITTAAQYSAAGQQDMVKSTGDLIHIMGAFGLVGSDSTKNLKEMADVSDIVVKAWTLLGGSITDVSGALAHSQLGPAAREVGMSLEQAAALISVFVKQGQSATAAGNLATRTLRILQKAAKDNYDEWQRLGVSIYDNTGKFRDISAIIENVNEKMKDLSPAMKSLTLRQLGLSGGAGAHGGQSPILYLLGQAEASKAAEEQMKQHGNTAKDVADRQLAAFNAQLTNMQNAFKALRVEIGADFQPVLASLMTVATEVLNWARELPEWLRKGAEYTVGFAVAVGVLTGGLYLFSIALGAIVAVEWAAKFGALVNLFYDTHRGALTAAGSFGVYALAITAVATAFGSLGYALAGGFAAQKQLNDEMQRSQELSDKIAKIANRTTPRILGELDKKPEAEKGKFLDEQIARANFEIEGQRNYVESLKEKVAELEPTWRSMWQSERAEWELSKQDLEQAKASLEQLRNLLDLLRGKKAKLPGPDELEAKVRGDIDALTKKLNKEIEAHGKTTEEAAIEGFKKAKATPEELKEVTKAADTREMQKQQVAIDEYNQAMRTKIETDGMGLVQTELYKLGLQRLDKVNLAVTKSLLEQTEAMNRRHEAEKEAAEVMKERYEATKALEKKFATPEEVFLKDLDNLNELLKYGGLGWETYQKAVEGAAQELSKARGEMEKLAAIQGAAVGSAEAYSRMIQFQQGTTLAPIGGGGGLTPQLEQAVNQIMNVPRRTTLTADEQRIQTNILRDIRDALKEKAPNQLEGANLGKGGGG